jgi:hypothetical protein
VRATLSVGADGQIALPQEGVKALGLAEGAEVDVVAARGGFALVTPATDDGAAAWFAGSLASLTVPEVIQFIFTTLKSGTLILAFGADARRVAEAGAGARPHRRTLYFREGQVVFGSSSDPADRLGAVLWRQGIVEQSELDRCGKLLRAGRPLGQILVDEKILTSGQLYEAITIQVKEIVLASCLEQEGEFAFIEGPFDESNSVKLDERTRDLLLQGLKRLEEVEQLAGQVGGRGAILVRGQADSEGLEGPEGKILELADGRRTLSEVARPLASRSRWCRRPPSRSVRRSRPRPPSRRRTTASTSRSRPRRPRRRLRRPPARSRPTGESSSTSSRRSRPTSPTRSPGSTATSIGCPPSRGRSSKGSGSTPTGRWTCRSS